MAKDTKQGSEVRIKDIPPRDLTTDQAKDVKGGRKAGNPSVKRSRNRGNR